MRLIRIKCRRVLQRLDLIDDRLADLRVSVSDTDREHAAKTVEILIALIIPDVKAFAADERERFLVVGGNSGEENRCLLVGAETSNWIAVGTKPGFTLML